MSQLEKSPKVNKDNFVDINNHSKSNNFISLNIFLSSNFNNFDLGKINI
jgi:hypothetical protein